MVTIDFTQEDGAATHGNLVMCSGLDPGNTEANCSMSDGGTAGTVEETSTANLATNERCAYMETDAVGETTWAAGDYTIRFDVTSLNSAVDLDSIHICRCNSAGVNQATVGSLTAIGRGLGTNQVESFTVSGSSQTAASTDRIYIVIGLLRNTGHGNQAVGWTPSQVINTPIERSAAAIDVGPMTPVSNTSIPAITVALAASLAVGPLTPVSNTSIPAIAVSLQPSVSVGPLAPVAGTTFPVIAVAPDAPFAIGPITPVDGTTIPAITVSISGPFELGPLTPVAGTTIPAITVSIAGAALSVGPLTPVSNTSFPAITLSLLGSQAIGPFAPVSGTSIPAITVAAGVSPVVGPVVPVSNTSIPAIAAEIQLPIGSLVPVANTTIPAVTVIHSANPEVALLPVSSTETPAVTVSIEKAMADITTRQTGLPRRQARTFDSELELRATGQIAITSETTLTPFLLLGDGARANVTVDVTAITGDCPVTVVLATDSAGTDVQDNLSYTIPGGDTGRFTIPVFVNLRGGLEGDTGRIFATIKVNPGTTITFSAYFSKATNDSLA